MKIYLAGSISGRSFAEAKASFDERANRLRAMGYEVINPVDYIGELKDETMLQPHGYSGTSSDAQVYQRSLEFVKECDIIWADFIGLEKVSIGSCFELAWANIYGKKVYITMGDNNIHQHAFINSAAHYIAWSYEYMYCQFERMEPYIGNYEQDN